MNLEAERLIIPAVPVSHPGLLERRLPLGHCHALFSPGLAVPCGFSVSFHLRRPGALLQNADEPHPHSPAPLEEFIVFFPLFFGHRYQLGGRDVIGGIWTVPLHYVVCRLLRPRLI